MYTACTGSAAEIFNSVTICKKARIQMKKDNSLPQKLVDSWTNVQIVVIDEISFMSIDDYNELDRRLRQIGDNIVAFGGFSVIFCRQFLEV